MTFSNRTIRDPLLAFFLINLIYFVQLKISNFSHFRALHTKIRSCTLALCFSANLDANALKIITILNPGVTRGETTNLQYVSPNLIKLASFGSKKIL